MTQRDAMPADIAAFIRAQPLSLGYAGLAEACRDKFGEGRAPSAHAIREWWLTQGGRPANSSGIGRDPEVAAFIVDRAGRMPVPGIMAKLRETFAASRVPSRSALYRHVATLIPKSPHMGRPSHIARDPEVEAFIRARAGTVPVAGILAQLQARFGAKRVPRRATLYRHISALLTQEALKTSVAGAAPSAHAD